LDDLTALSFSANPELFNFCVRERICESSK